MGEVNSETDPRFGSRWWGAHHGEPRGPRIELILFKDLHYPSWTLIRGHVVSTLIMAVGTNMRKLGHFLEECEGGVGTVHNVECADSETGLSADIELTVSTQPPGRDREGFVPTAVEIDGDGYLEVGLESTAPVVPTADHDLEVESLNATFNADGTITLILDASVPDGVESTDSQDATGRNRPSSPLEADDEPGEETAGGHDRELPPFRDAALLAELYESCETFAEMAEVIEMDVTAETVRRYMIDHGIHEPNSYETAGGGDDESEPGSDPAAGSTASGEERPDPSSSPDREHDRPSPVALTDGIGLPDGVSLDALVEAVSRSNTIYEVRQEIELEREETLELLRRLDLVDLVVGRISSEHERDIGREEIVARLREASTTRPRP